MMMMMMMLMLMLMMMLRMITLTGYKRLRCIRFPLDLHDFPRVAGELQRYVCWL